MGFANHITIDEFKREGSVSALATILLGDLPYIGQFLRGRSLLFVAKRIPPFPVSKR
ncbi:MAG TPA: hypothetical protein VK589_14840 [Chryseolinea sp.]|nr:hypothetical protein [Chryseolinea sp.]